MRRTYFSYALSLFLVASCILIILIAGQGQYYSYIVPLLILLGFLLQFFIASSKKGVYNVSALKPWHKECFLIDSMDSKKLQKLFSAENITYTRRDGNYELFVPGNIVNMMGHTVYIAMAKVGNKQAITVFSQNRFAWGLFDFGKNFDIVQELKRHILKVANIQGEVLQAEKVVSHFSKAKLFSSLHLISTGVVFLGVLLKILHLDFAMTLIYSGVAIAFLISIYQFVTNHY